MSEYREWNIRRVSNIYNNEDEWNGKGEIDVTGDGGDLGDSVITTTSGRVPLLYLQLRTRRLSRYVETSQWY